jgi:hypothetical protein
MIEMKIVIAIAVAILMVALVPSISMTMAFASHSSSPAACQSDGHETGQDGSFSQELYDMCGEPYYDGFIEGCMDADNSRETCEQATDAD